MAASYHPVQISPRTCCFPFSRQIHTFNTPRRRLCFTNSKGQFIFFSFVALTLLLDFITSLALVFSVNETGKSIGMNSELFFPITFLSLDYVLFDFQNFCLLFVSQGWESDGTDMEFMYGHLVVRSLLQRVVGRGSKYLLRGMRSLTNCFRTGRYSTQMNKMQ